MWVYAQLALFITYLTLLSTYVASDKENWGLLISLIVFNTFFLVAEIPLFLLGPLNYITDVWNILDSLRILLIYIYPFFKNNSLFISEYVFGAVILCSWIRALAFFRIFKRTRYFVRIILEVLIDIVPFTFVLLYSILSVALVGYSLHNSSEDSTSFSNE